MAGNSIFIKRCSKCKKYKWSYEFNKFKRSKDGLQGYCRVCDNAYCNSRRVKVNGCNSKVEVPKTLIDLRKEAITKLAYVINNPLVDPTEVVGCNRQQLNVWLAMTLLPGYTNTRLHIDHVIPLALFKEDNIHLANSLYNLQYLPADENIKKDKLLDNYLDNQYYTLDAFTNMLSEYDNGVTNFIDLVTIIAIQDFKLY